MDQRTKDRLETTNRELAAFIAAVSHDFRAPLRNIDGFSQALEEDYSHVLDATGRDFLKRIRASVLQMGRLIDGLQDLGRVTRAEMNPNPVDLSETVRRLADRIAAENPGRDVRFHVQDGLLTRCDAGLLGIALEHLLRNAWKFTGKHDKAQIEFGATEGEDGLVFFVRDDGVGFEPAYADKLFGVFQRLHLADEFPGIGMGLALVQRIIHRHGGRIWGEGEPEKGATFHFTLPGGG